MKKPNKTPHEAIEISDNKIEGNSNQSVLMSVRILDELTKSGQSIGVSEMARLLNESKGRIHRHLSTLKSLGLVNQEIETERYVLGWKIYQWGASLGDNFGMKKIADTHLNDLRDLTEHTTVFAIPAQGNALILSSIESDSRIAIRVKQGVIVSAGGSALGRTILAFSSKTLQDKMLDRPLQVETLGTAANPDFIAARLEKIRENFFETAVNENIFGIATLAAPVFSQDRNIAGAIAIIGSPYTITVPPCKKMLTHLQCTAQKMSEALGSTQWSKFFNK